MHLMQVRIIFRLFSGPFGRSINNRGVKCIGRFVICYRRDERWPRRIRDSPTAVGTDNQQQIFDSQFSIIFNTRSPGPIVSEPSHATATRVGAQHILGRRVIDGRNSLLAHHRKNGLNSLR